MTGTIGVWPPLSPAVLTRKPARVLPFPLEDPRCALFARGRHALFHGLRPVGLGAGDRVLVPAYHHGSEVEALLAAGVVPVFYGGDGQLAPDEDELEVLLTRQVRALLLIHYLGFPQDAARWSDWSEHHGLVLIEDAAQAWLASVDGEPVGLRGDLSIFCLYKTFGLPDGAAGVLRGEPNFLALRGRSALGLVGLASRQAAWWSARSNVAARGAGRVRKSRPYVAAQDFALGEAARGVSLATSLLLPRVVDGAAAERRRKNYSMLLEGLAELVPAPFDRLPDGAAPFAFPIDVDDKRRVLEQLAAAGIGGLDFWSTPHDALPQHAFEAIARRRSRTIGLPVHQELRDADLERIVETLRARRRRAARPELELSSFDALRSEWPELARRSENIFATRDWLTTWWTHFGRGRDSAVVAWRSSGGQLRAAFPFYRWRSTPLSIARFIGHGPADELGPVCAPGDRDVAVRLLRDALAVGPWLWDVFVGEQLLQAHAVPGARVLSREPNPVLVTNGMRWSEFLATRSRNLREQVRRREDRLVGAHGVSFRLADDRSRLDADLTLFFALHGARWAGESALLGLEAFHREFAAVAFDRGWLRLWFLEAEGRPVAAWYGFRFGGVESYYQAGRDPAWDRWSPGWVLLVHTMRAALDDGVREYRFLRGGEPFKYRFATEDRPLATVALSRGRVGAAAVRAGALLGRRRPRRLMRWYRWI